MSTKEQETIQELNVKKANYLVPFEERMSKSSQLCVSFLISCLPKSKVENGFPEMTFSFREIKKVVNADGKRRITDVDDLWKVHSELMSVPLWYENEEKQGMVSWMTEISFDKRSNNFTYYFHPKLERHLLNVKNQFTLYNYYYRVCLSPNAMKFYELMKMHEVTGKVSMDIEIDIKAPLGLQGKYSAFYDLKRKVLEPIKKELKQFTDIEIEYEPDEKEGKRVISLLFIITQSEPTDLPTPLREVLELQAKNPLATQLSIDDELSAEEYQSKYSDLYKQLIEWGGSTPIVTNMIRNYGADRVKFIMRYTQFEMEGGGLEREDIMDFMMKGLQSDWMRPRADGRKKKEILN